MLCADLHTELQTLLLFKHSKTELQIRDIYRSLYTCDDNMSQVQKLFRKIIFKLLSSCARYRLALECIYDISRRVPIKHEYQLRHVVSHFSLQSDWWFSARAHSGTPPDVFPDNGTAEYRAIVATTTTFGLSMLVWNLAISVLHQW